jgi:hypothetical protein
MPQRHPDSIALLPSEETTEARGGRRRAPRRTGRRAQLTVPEHLWSEIVSIANAAGTTPNDILIRLAAERLEERRRPPATGQPRLRPRPRTPAGG